VWSASIGLSNEVGYQAHWMLLADDAGGLLWILQGVSRLSKVWKYPESSSISFQSYYQAMAIQRIGYRFDWLNKSSI
jgi:hypothetical protein